MMAIVNRMRDRLARGEVALCMATRLARTAEIAMIADACGLDAFFIDMEHCPISLDATRLLDAGALGIICPHVDTLEQAKAFAGACRFPPVGGRSVGGSGPLQGYRATPLGAINAQGNAVTLCIAMLETPEAIDNADAIAALAGIDGLLIGSNDLCTALGIPGELKHPKLRAAYASAAKACKAHNKYLGVGGIRNDVEHVAELVKLGARFVIVASDVQYLMMAARTEVAALRTATSL
jgi:2-keto-3-deoxy-L-rhamnonate aldolase RhmA